MSIEPEDMLEEALRGDLPTPDAEARVRRRLVAAGVAVGNGVAATTAAASGAGAAGTAAKAAGLSWGLKVGLAAFIGIPTVGLWLEGRAPQPAAVSAPAAVTAPTHASQAQPQAAAAPTAEPASEVEAPVARDVERNPARSAKVTAADEAPAADVAPNRAHPSQADFAAAEPPTRSPQAPSTLAEETRILDAALAALAAGDRARAAALLQEHARRFPAGLLQQERERANTRLTEMSRGE